MPRITICPRCTSHLALPADVSPVAQAQCPICEVEFSLTTVVPRDLPQARIIIGNVEADFPTATPQELSAQEGLSQLIRSTAARPIEHDEGDRTESYDDAYRDADPETAPVGRSQAPPDEKQLGSSRLDQLLSDLIKTPTSSLPSSTAKTVSFAEQQTVEADSPLVNNFEAELEDDVRPPADAGLTESRDERFAAQAADAEPDRAEQNDAESDAESLDDEVPTFSDRASNEELPRDLQTTPRRQSRRSPVRTLIGVVGGGALGILLGAYGLLWLRGAEGDFLGIANYLPPSMLPSSTKHVADDDAASRGSEPPAPSIESDEQESALAVVEQPPMEFDPAVAPATAEEPIAEPEEENSLGKVLPQTPVAPPDAAQPPAEQQTWPTTPIVGDLRGVKLYSTDELAELLPAADAAHREFLTGDLAREESWSAMGPAYMTIASLAERYTLVDPAEQGTELITKQIAAKNIFRGLLGKPQRRADLATVAARWLQHERRLNQGVILVGRVIDLRPQGKWTQYTINVPLGDSFVAAEVLMDRIEFSFGDEVAVVGAIVPRPQEQLAGYEGDARQVVIAGYCFAPETFVAPRSDAVSGRFPFESSKGGE